MKPLISVVCAAALLGGCQDRTGEDWLDALTVRDFDERVELTLALEGRDSYCDFGCDHVCSMTPEPSVYRELDQQNQRKLIEMRERAESSGLVFDVGDESGIIYDPRHPPKLRPEEIAMAKLECIQKQRKHIERIETLLDRLTSKDV